jgi:F0F1-type ATP synthase membrane subunit c/vacuolar-type H+-ATPase subunit K
LIDVEENLKLLFARFLTAKKIVANKIHAFEERAQLFLKVFLSFAVAHFYVLYGLLINLLGTNEAQEFWT